VPVIGLVVQSVAAEPPSILFGSRPVGTTVEQTFMLRARDGRVFTVGEISSSLGGLRVEEVPSPATGGRAYRATYVIDKPGRLFGEIHLTARPTDRAEFKMRVPVYCYGLSPS
jgi:hypothetical protein